MALDSTGTASYPMSIPICIMYLLELHRQYLIYCLNKHPEFRWECYGNCWAGITFFPTWPLALLPLKQSC
jgi:hypothetical protein